MDVLLKMPPDKRNDRDLIGRIITIIESIFPSGT
jgi:hypothetical protein